MYISFYRVALGEPYMKPGLAGMKNAMPAYLFCF